MESEQNIIHRLKKGDLEAIQLVIEKYQDYVYTLAFQIVKSSTIAEDLTQDVFIKVYRKIGTFREDSKFSTWLYTITCRTCFNYMSRKKIVFNLSELENVEETKISIDNFYYETDEQKPENLTEILWNAIDKLPYNHGLTITLYYLQQFSIKEISQIMDIPENTIKTNLYRGRAALKLILADKISEEEIL
jgi:RNA polymerase sigma-70 factor (ECF subfamily)